MNVSPDFITFFFSGLCCGLLLGVGIWIIRAGFNFVRGILTDSPAWENIV